MNQMHDEIQHLDLVKRRIAVLSGGGGASESKNSRANDRADAQGRQRPGAQGFFEPVFRLFRLGDQLVNRFLGEKLAGQDGLLV